MIGVEPFKLEVERRVHDYRQPIFRFFLWLACFWLLFWFAALFDVKAGLQFGGHLSKSYGIFRIAVGHEDGEVQKVASGPAAEALEDALFQIRRE
jgi:hypothetical protein